LRLNDLTEGRVPADTEVTGLTADSRAVRPGFLFAALPGTQADGLDYAAEAVRRGAVCVLGRPDPRLGALAVPTLADPEPRRRFALLAARFFGRQPRIVAAVTGTNGKSSVADFTRQLWTGLGLRAASVGTLGVLCDGRETPLQHTTPEPATLHRILAELADEGVECAALEASSHGLHQNRLDGVDVAAGAFTSFSRDHLDYHATADDYLATKLRLFDAVMPPGRTAVLNADMAEFGQAAAACARRRHRVVSYGAHGVELKLRGCEARAAGQRLDLEAFGLRSEIELPLVGEFQAMNALCAVGLAVAAGAEPERIVGLLPKLAGVRGRLERVGAMRGGGAVYVDYAHTPDALEKALKALRPHAAGRLVVAFGCGGNRDRGKRPQMGRIAAALADRVIVTDDNPRRERAETIRAEILAACPGAEDIGDRAAAIRAGLRGLGSGDLFLIAGKGHERGQVIGDETHPFDDVEEARAALAEAGGRA
jgi:UDP-N-acetylmuramoyl-L-alanyl-D-glutamate--2,6-diaminopimelate ligase